MPPPSRSFPSALFFAGLLTAALLPRPAAAQAFFRIGGGLDRSSSTTLRDVDCASTTPPALFGCGNGADDRTLGARGAFRTSPAWELGFGRAQGRTRIELDITARPHVDLDAAANFLGAGAEQPVRANGRSLAAIAVVSVDLARSDQRIRPFVLAGGGIARNVTGRVRYDFPALGSGASTVTAGGTADTFAWTAGAGLAFPLTRAVDLDILVRRTDLGGIRTDAGTAEILRPSRELHIDIGSTRGRLRSDGIAVSLRIHPLP